MGNDKGVSLQVVMKKLETIEKRLPELGKGRGNYYLVKKPNTAESIEHFFLTELLYEEICKHTSKVIKYSTVGPDIEFIAPYNN